MNKTNIIGILLMGAVIMLYMYLNKPSAEQQAAVAEKARQEQALAQQSDVNSAAVLTDTIVTPQERQIIVSTIREFGSKDSAGVVTLTAPKVRMTLTADSIVGGSVSVSGGTAVALSDILASNYGSLSRGQAAEACANLRKALADVARYKGFFRLISEAIRQPYASRIRVWPSTSPTKAL